MKLEFYVSQSGKVPVKNYIGAIKNKIERAKLLEALASIEDYGFETPRVKFRQMKGKLWEIKASTGGKHHRIFYVMILEGNMILLHAYLKKTPKAPAREIVVAATRMNEVLES